MKVSKLQLYLSSLSVHNSSIFKKLGGLETMWLRDSLDSIKINQPIYISGLARSGTTLLLEILAQHPDLSCHKYKDFPLLTIPFWWNWFLKHAGNSQTSKQERAHKDRIKVSSESPEAMEEVLWMQFFKTIHDPDVNNILAKDDFDLTFNQFYQEHIKKILFIRGGQRYLSKANYNVSRLEYLHHLFPDALFIVPVRNPVNHIASLVKQHNLFCTAEQSDPQVLTYMQRLGHFEFGLDRRANNLNNQELTKKIDECWSNRESELLGWALSWKNVYSYLFRLMKENKKLAKQTLWVDYDRLCREPEESLKKIYSHCKTEIAPSLIKQQAATISAPDYYRHEFSNQMLDEIRHHTESTFNDIHCLISPL